MLLDKSNEYREVAPPPYLVEKESASKDNLRRAHHVTYEVPSIYTLSRIYPMS